LKITPALLLCGAVLIVAAPLWANRIDSEHGSTIDEFSADSAPAAAFAERFQPKLTMDGRDARVDVHPFTPGEFESRELAFIFSRDFSRDASRNELREKDVRRDKNEGTGSNGLLVPKIIAGTDSAPVPISEPASLPLLLAGLAAIGLWSRRRELA
jgi:hypothetical protein